VCIKGSKLRDWRGKINLESKEHVKSPVENRKVRNEKKKATVEFGTKVKKKRATKANRQRGVKSSKQPDSPRNDKPPDRAQLPWGVPGVQGQKTDGGKTLTRGTTGSQGISAPKMGQAEGGTKTEREETSSRWAKSEKRLKAEKSLDTKKHPG